MPSEHGFVSDCTDERRQSLDVSVNDPLPDAWLPVPWGAAASTRPLYPTGVATLEPMTDQQDGARLRASRIAGATAIVLTVIAALLVQAGASLLTLASPAMTDCRPREIPLSAAAWYLGALLVIGGSVYAAAKTARALTSTALPYALLLTAILGIVTFSGLAILIAGLMGFAEMDDPGRPPTGGPVLLLIAALSTPAWALGASSILMLSKRRRVPSNPAASLIAFAAITATSVGLQLVRFTLTC